MMLGRLKSSWGDCSMLLRGCAMLQGGLCNAAKQTVQGCRADCNAARETVQYRMS